MHYNLMYLNILGKERPPNINNQDDMARWKLCKLARKVTNIIFREIREMVIILAKCHIYQYVRESLNRLITKVTRSTKLYLSTLLLVSLFFIVITFYFGGLRSE